MIQVFLEKDFIQWPEFHKTGLKVYCHDDILLDKRGIMEVPLHLSIRYPENMIARFIPASNLAGILWYSDSIIDYDVPIVLYFLNGRPSDINLKGKELGYIYFTDTAKYENSISKSFTI